MESRAHHNFVLKSARVMTQQQSTFAYIAWDACQESFKRVADQRAGHPLNCARLMPRMAEDVFPVLPTDAPWDAIHKAEELAAIIHARYGMNHNIAIWSDPDVLNFVPVVTEITRYLDGLITYSEWGCERKSQPPSLWQFPLMPGVSNGLMAPLFMLPAVAGTSFLLMAFVPRTYVVAALVASASCVAWAWLIAWLIVRELSEKTNFTVTFDSPSPRPHLQVPSTAHYDFPEDE